MQTSGYIKMGCQAKGCNKPEAKYKIHTAEGNIEYLCEKHKRQHFKGKEVF